MKYVKENAELSMAGPSHFKFWVIGHRTDPKVFTKKVKRRHLVGQRNNGNQRIIVDSSSFFPVWHVPAI